jgi:hypothetical protein
VVNQDEEFERRYEREELLYSLLVPPIIGSTFTRFPQALKQWLTGIVRRRKLRKLRNE